jgi:transglutaminase-like putative cysteine protease
LKLDSLYTAWREGRTVPIEAVVVGAVYLICTIVFLAVYRHINILYSLFFAALFFAAFYFEFRRSFAIPRWLLNSISLGVVVFSVYRFDVNDLISQMMEALLILIAIKLLEEKKVRDYMQVYAMSLLLLAGLGLVSLSISFLVYFTGLIFLLSVAIVLLTFYAQDEKMEASREIFAKIVSRSLFIPLLAIPLTLFMFIILPRSQYPLLNFLNRSDTAKTGFSDNVKLGAVSNIQEDSSIIFRVNMDRIDERDLYWRGIVFDRFDGSSWTRSRRAEGEAPKPVLLKGRSVRQTFYLEPYGNYYFFSLDKPVFLSLRGIRKNRDLTLVSARFVERRVRYDVISILSDTAYEEAIDRDLYLQIPPETSGRIIKLVRELTAAKDEEQSIRAIFNFLSRGEYRYSLENLPLSKNPLETFLLDTKYGNCEFFASSFALMLRIAGIPARIVGGYKGGYYNDMGQYYLVPQKNAHVWVEAFTAQNRWLRLDPTPGSIDNYTSLLKGNIFLRMRVFFDTINYYWYAMVINYNFEKQLSIGELLSAKYLILLGLAGLIVFGVLALLKGRIPQEKKLLSLFLRRMESHGYRKGKSQGLEEFAATIDNPELRQRAERFVREFEKLYFQDKVLQKEDITRLRASLKEIAI